MIRFIRLSRLVLALSICVVLTQPVHAKDASATAPQPSGIAEVVSLVERALVEPVADLERKARKGYASDKLVYGLALKAGRAGSGQGENAQKWIKKARNSFERPSHGKSQDSQVIGNAEQSVSTAPAGGRSSQGNIPSSFSAKMNPDIILVAEACVDALLMAPDTNPNVHACGGDAEYQRLLEVMWTSAATEAMREIVGLVEAALTQPIKQLERRAKGSGGRDKLIYGLALKAGRMGPEGIIAADKWIERARQAYDHGGTTFIAGGAAMPSTAETTPLFGYDLFSRYAGGRVIMVPGVEITRAVVQPILIDIATQCVVALGSAPGQSVDMSVCGGEAEYLRLKALMPKP